MAAAVASLGPSLRQRAVLATIIVSALFAFYLPSSVGGAISRPLSIVSIGGMCALFVLMAVAAGRTGPALNMVASLSIFLLLALFTITSPFDQYSPGVVMLYFAVVVLFALDLRGLTSRGVDFTFQCITIASLIVGYAVAANISAVDRILAQWYAAFYPELVPNMLSLNKPVLSFATHSTAGFMVYLLFYLQLHAWSHTRRWWNLAAAVAVAGLLVALSSTTSQAFFVVAAAQLTLSVLARVPARLTLMAVIGMLIVAVAALVALQVDVAALGQRAREAIVGDKIRGLASRYASNGLLANNFAYLMESPFTPIGFGASDTLYLGDSGVIVNLLRGSVPLLVTVYLSFWLFLRTNIVDRRAALVVWLSTLAFDVGFTPMMYFRFVAFVPFMVVYLNSVSAMEPERLSRT